MNGDIGEPKRMERAKIWSEQAEEAWRLQQAGYRDIFDYQKIRNKAPERWDDDKNRIKKLEVVPKRKRGEAGDDCYFMYFDKKPELEKRELHTVKIYHR